jgi:hypothetical protein
LASTIYLCPIDPDGLAGDLDIDVVELDEYGLPEVRSDG